MDIVIFPNSENLIVHDEVIEYLPQNPMHVRIKGVDHPVLQSCLVKGTEYVTTAALKNFHPEIYGSYLPHLAGFVNRALQVASREGINSCIWEWKNNPTSPAVTLNYARSNCSITEELEKQKDPQNLANLDVSEWEWMAHDLCTSRGIPYTRDHAQVINDYFQYVNEVQMSLNKCGLSGVPRMFPDVVQELLFSDRAEALKARYRDIDRRTQNESKRMSISSIAAAHKPDKRDNDQKWVTPQYCDDDKSENSEEHCLQGALPRLPSIGRPCVTPNVTSRNADDDQNSAERCTSNRRWTPTSSQSAAMYPPEKSLQLQEKVLCQQATESKELFDRRGQKTDGHADRIGIRNNPEAKKPQTSAQKVGVPCKEPSYNPEQGNKEDEKWEKAEERIHERFFKHLFETVTDAKADTPSKGTGSKETEKAQLQAELQGGFDFVPALRCQGWPKVSRSWIKRERKWPSPDMVDRIIQDGFHLVVKPPKNGGNADCDFRISFSHAEYLLSQEMNDIQRECYRCLKKFHRAYLSKEPKGLVTFHLKNILLQTIEETGAEMWTESNRAACVMTLLGNLLQVLTKKDLRHFFVRSYNLFGEDYIESPKFLESWAGIVEKIMENPMQFAKELLQHQEDATQVPNTNPSPAEPAIGLRRSEMGKSSSKQLKTGTANQGSTCSSTSLRFRDMKEIFLATSKELIDIAFNDTGSAKIVTLDPLERSLVDDLREIERKHNIPIEVFPMMFDDECWDMAYYKVWTSTEPDMRHRVLDGIQGVIEMWKYILQQDDFGTGNEEAIFRRMVDPTSENPFDLSHVLPAGAGTQFLNRLVNSVKPRPAETQVVDDLIPLDWSDCCKTDFGGYYHWMDEKRLQGLSIPSTT